MAERGRAEAREKDEQSPYGAGFVAAAIVLSAVLLCGVLLVVTSLADAGPAEASLPKATSSAGTPRTDDPSGTPSARTGCGLPDGDQAVPLSAPRGTEWVVYRRTVVPQHDTIGPARIDPDGFRRCFAHSPTGAVYAAYNAIAALGDQARVLPTARKLLLPGPDRDRLLRELLAEPAEPEDGSRAGLAAYRIIDASRDRVSLAIAMRDGDSLGSGTFTMVWHDGDWRVLPPRAGEQFGAPYTQLDGLGDFVVWGGV